MKESYTGTLNPRIFSIPGIAVQSNSSTSALPTSHHQVEEPTLAMMPSTILFFPWRSSRKQLARQPFSLLKSSGFLMMLTTWRLRHLTRHSSPQVGGKEPQTKHPLHQIPQRK